MTKPTLEQVRAVKRDAIAARPARKMPMASPEAQALEAAWNTFYSAIYRAETDAMAREMNAAKK